MAINRALAAGFDVEVDVWWLDGDWYLGHDAPQTLVERELLCRPELWCHAKHIPALAMLREIGAHCFMHDQDPATLTSRGRIWGLPQRPLAIQRTGIIVLPETWSQSTIDWASVDGVCTDYSELYRRQRDAANSDHVL